MPLTQRLVEVEVTRRREVVQNWPWDFSAVSGPIFKLFVSLALRISSPIRLWPLRTDWSKSGSFKSTIPFLKLYHLVVKEQNQSVFPQMKRSREAKVTKRSGSSDWSDICGLDPRSATAQFTRRRTSRKRKFSFSLFFCTKREEKRTRFSRGSSWKVRPQISAKLGMNFSRGRVSKNANAKGRPFLDLFSTFCHGRASKNPAQVPSSNWKLPEFCLGRSRFNRLTHVGAA